MPPKKTSIQLNQKAAGYLLAAGNAQKREQVAMKAYIKKATAAPKKTAKKK